MPTGWDVAYFVLLPFAWLLHFVLYVLRLIAAPVIFLLRAVCRVCMIPLHFLARFETLFYYFGAAILVGALLGSGLHVVGRFLKTALALHDNDDPDDKLMQASWREQLEARKARREPRPGPLERPSLKLATPSTGYTGLPQHNKLTPKSPSPMMSTAIHEEDDSSEDYVF